MIALKLFQMIYLLVFAVLLKIFLIVCLFVFMLVLKLYYCLVLVVLLEVKTNVKKALKIINKA